MSNPNVLTGPTSPVSVPNLFTGLLMGNVAGIPQPDTAIGALNSTIVSMLFTLILQQKYSPNTKDSFHSVYDYIIVGGGVAGSVVASRLSEKYCVTVLVLEAGKTPPAFSELPAGARAMEITDTNWSFLTEPQEHTAGAQYQKRIPYPAGKGLGGTSLIGDMIYTRGSREDYNAWEAMGAEGWSYNGVFPYFLKLENNTDADLVSNMSCHNVSGPMSFSRIPYTSNVRTSLVEGAESLGYKVVDPNCENQLGIADFQASIRRGQRCSTAKAYLVPAENRTNLDMITEAYVTKINITNGTAQGVFFNYKGSLHYVRARKEVIVSAGPIKTPQILMLSGIGPRETLGKLNIQVHKDSPVGNNLQDHVTTAMFLIETLDPRYEVKLISSIPQYLSTRSGPFAVPAGILSLGHYRSDNSTTPNVPNFQTYFAEMDTNAARLTFGLKLTSYEQLFLINEPYAILACFSSVMNPKSRGIVTINSTDPYDDPVINPKYLSDQQDVEAIVAGLKLCRDIVKTPVARSAGIKPFGTKISGCEAFDVNTNQYLECYVTKFAFSSGDYACTAKMGNDSDPAAVVDPKLRVKEIGKLRVVDASTMPKLVSGNAMIPTIMMAEKASDIIKETINSC